MSKYRCAFDKIAFQHVYAKEPLIVVRPDNIAYLWWSPTGILYGPFAPGWHVFTHAELGHALLHRRTLSGAIGMLAKHYNQHQDAIRRSIDGDYRFDQDRLIA